MQIHTEHREITRYHTRQWKIWHVLQRPGTSNRQLVMAHSTPMSWRCSVTSPKLLLWTSVTTSRVTCCITLYWLCSMPALLFSSVNRLELSDKSMGMVARTLSVLRWLTVLQNVHYKISCTITWQTSNHSCGCVVVCLKPYHFARVYEQSY